ncbi:hypothetical protein PRIPAC_73006 [Pristionchus pacificus]|uniref:Uncharacterized protein n=1 Tax=Pristionchus pacificus TaxID=54126 RepID=A0A454XVI1_PRIPA|nr:hypothetical protein PRIPAC_73006 [Pristionchus pacificus]|eukprot:PDM74456.1 hypothetical protein PRIPAC_41812 [Pristionchus pacificus]
MSSIRIPVHLLMSNYQFEKIETFEFWDPTVLKVSYRPYAIQHSIIALVAHIPVVLLIHSINIFSNAFSRHRSTVVLTTHGLLLFTVPQYLFYACLALLVWDNTYIPIGVCSILKNFSSYLAQTGYNVIPVVAFYRYLNVVWQFRADNTLAWLSTLIVAVPNIGLAISSTFFGLPTPGEICAIIYLYHSNSAVMMIQAYMLTLQLFSIVLHLRVACYLRKIDPGLTSSSSKSSTNKKRPRLMTHSHTLNVVVQKTRTDYCITLALLLHSLTILAAMIMQSVWGLAYMNAGYVVTRSFALDLIDALPIAAPGLIALFSLLSIRESRTYVRQLFKRAKRGNPRIVTSAPSVSIVEKDGFH